MNESSQQTSIENPVSQRSTGPTARLHWQRIAAILVSVAALVLTISHFSETAAILEKNLLELYLGELIGSVSDYRFPLRKVVLGIGLAGLALGLEALIRGWSNSSARRLFRRADGSARNDLFYWFVTTFGFVGVIRVAMTLGGATLVKYGITTVFPDFALVQKVGNEPLQYLIAFLVLDYLGYAQHRLAHSWGWWWELHKIHHSAESFNMITAYRTHFLENVPRSVVYGIGLAFTGNLSAFIFYNALLEFVNLVLHSELQYKWGWFENFLVTPRNHKIHHSVDPEHHDKNFGFTLIVWDRIFGTFHRPKDGEEVEIGLRNNPYNKRNPVVELFSAYGSSLKRLFGASPK